MRYFLALGLFGVLASAPSAFLDATASARIGFVFEAGKTPAKYLIEAMGGGVAMIDADGDGWLALFFVNGAALVDGPVGPLPDGRGSVSRVRADKSEPRFWNRLYRNQGDGTFAYISDKVGVRGHGYGQGVAVGDCDNDGRPDLYVTCLGANILYSNRGGCRFEDVSVQSGIAKTPGKGLGVAFNDVDRDGWPDILVANDSFPQQLFRNRRNGTFEEAALPMGIAYDEDGKVFAGMGADLADYDNDGRSDGFVNGPANQGYGLFHKGKGLFSYTAGVAAIPRMHSGWGRIFVAQGHVMDNIERTQPGLRYRETPLLMRNRSGEFIDVSAQAAPPFQAPMAARGAAFGDLNSDGAVDAVVSSSTGAPRVFRNAAADNGWLLVNTIGEKSNRDGIGASVHIIGESGHEQFGYVTTAGSYLSAHDKRVHFGLGRDRVVKRIEIRWPSGIVQTWNNVAANQIFEAKEAENGSF